MEEMYEASLAARPLQGVKLPVSGRFVLGVFRASFFLGGFNKYRTSGGGSLDV